MIWMFLIWSFITSSTATFFVLLVIDAYKQLQAYYKELGIKTPSSKASIGAKLASLMKCVFIVICPLLHIVFLVSFVLFYEEICRKTVIAYIQDHKTQELELSKEKENEC